MVTDTPIAAAAAVKDPQAGGDVYVHSVEFRPDGAVDVTISERHGMGEKAAITKMVSIHRDLLPEGELGELIDTIVDWTDLAWRHIRGS